MKKLFWAVPMMALAALTSCEKENNNNNQNPTPSFGSITIELEHVWENQAVTIPHSGHFETNSGEHIMFSKLNYYLTKVQLIANDGTTWTEEDSYHLVQLGANNTIDLNLQDVPTADYVAVRFLIGVDSTHNVSGPQTGALDPANEMFWSWNNGYIFLKAEGLEHMSGTAFRYHIGGFRNSNSTNAIQEVAFNFAPMMAEVRQDATPILHCMVDVQKLFDGQAMALQVGANPTVHMPGMMAVNIARNYVGMFELDHVHN